MKMDDLCILNGQTSFACAHSYTSIDFISLSCYFAFYKSVLKVALQYIFKIRTIRYHDDNINKIKRVKKLRVFCGGSVKKKKCNAFYCIYF